ncbi:MAG TPA: HD domain-containing phosphohydrolase, partial [Anaerolineales bacterium]|nr:HD domain-containing phosphohydrolase [Anaerolineales bacterium]
VDRLVPARFRGKHAGFRAGFLTELGARPIGMGRDLFGLHKDGSEFPVEIGLSPIETGSGMLVLATIIDITQRKQAEQEIESLANFPKENTGPVLRFARDGRLLYANLASADLLRMWGCEIGDRPPDEIQLIVYQSLVIPRSQEIEVAHGDRVDALMFVPIVDKNYVNVYGRDITERKQAEGALHESEERFRRAIEDAPYPVIIHAEDGEIISVNTIWLKLSGYAREEIPTIDTWTERAYGERNAIVQAAIGKLFALENVIDEGEDVVRTASGEIRTWHFSSAPLGRLPDGRRIVISMANDVTERNRAKSIVKKHLERLTALREIDRAIVSTSNVQLSLSILLTQTLALLGIDAGDILLVNPALNLLEYSAGRGFKTKTIENLPVRLGEGLAGRAALTGETVEIPDLNRTQLDPFFKSLVHEEGFVEYVGVPLISKGKVLGVLEAYQRKAVSRDADWLNFLESLAGQASIAIDNAQTFESMQRLNMELIMAYDATIEGWSRAMDLRDRETEGHTLRVTALTIKLAERMDVKMQEQAQMRWGALLHDIGKLGTPDSILLKPGKLTDDEWEIMKYHPVLARDMLSPIVYLRLAIDIPYCHHEKWDGTGYPQGLAGEQIPLSARIFAIVDVWDALTSDRPYRSAWSREQTMEYIREQSGKHFDPRVVEAFLEMMEDA